MIWFYENREVKSEDLTNYKAFVYKITNLLNGKVYYGKKRTFFTNKKRVKGRKNRVLVKRESDWQEYYGSNEDLKADVQRYRPHNFRREILRLCKTLSEANYYELRYQMVNDVLFHPHLFYNSYIGTRVSRKQLGVKE